MKKRCILLSVLFLLVTIFVIPCCVFADDATEEASVLQDGSYRYRIEEVDGEKKAVLIEILGDFESFLEVPNLLGEYPIYKIEEKAFVNCEAREIHLSEGIQVIGKDAFESCDSYILSIPTTVTEIHPEAFGVRDEDGCTLDRIRLITDFGSLAQEYALTNGMNYCLNSYEEFDDGSVQVRVEDPTLLETGTRLRLDLIAEGQEFEELTKDFDASAMMFELSFVKDGKEITAEGKMRIHVDNPSMDGIFGTYYRIQEDGSLSEIKIEDMYYESGKIWFDETALGKYLYVHVNNSDSTEFFIQDGVLIKYIGNEETVVVPEGVTIIETDSFYDYFSSYLCNVKNVILPEGVTTIKRSAFMRRYLESVTIPDSIEVIEKNAFDYDPPEPWEVEPIPMPITIYGKTLTVAELYATENGDTFIPTNDQLRGDVNGNGIFEAEDALGILKMVVKLETMYGYSADANEDGEVGADDALTVLMKVVGLLPEEYPTVSPKIQEDLLKQMKTSSNELSVMIWFYDSSPEDYYEYNASIIEELGIDEEDISFHSEYSPMMIATLSDAEIYRIAEHEKVYSLSYNEPMNPDEPEP